MKKVVIRFNDNSIAICHPNYKKYGDEDGKIPFSQLKSLNEFISREGYCGYEIVDHEELPSKEGLGERERLYWENEDGVIKYKIDTDFTKVLMHPQTVLKKRIDKINKVIQSSNDDTPLADIIRKYMERDRIVGYIAKLNELNRDKNKNKKELNSLLCIIYNTSLEALNARVNGGEPDKPLVRSKIVSKIEELQQSLGD